MNTSKGNTGEMMRQISFFFSVAIILALSIGTAQAQEGSIYISNVAGEVGQDSLGVGQEIVWTLNMHNNNSVEMVASNNGINVYSPDGAIWTPIHVDTAGIPAFINSYGAGNTFLYHDPGNSGSGTSGDIIGIGGFDTRFPCVGFGPGFNAPAFTVSIPSPGIDSASHGKTICIDSSGYNINTEWLWGFCDGSGGNVIWGPIGSPYGGPVCYTIVNPSAPSESNLIVSPQTLGYNATEGGSNPASQMFDVTSDGDPLNFDVTESSSWITLNKANGTTPTNVTVSVDITGLSPATYVDTITVSSADAANSPQLVEVTLEVAAAPKFLATAPDTLSFTAQEGGSNPASQDFEVSETGAFNIAYTLTKSSAWYSLNKAGGTTTDTVTVNVDIFRLAAGTYLDSVEVASGEASNSPIYEYITLEVTPAPQFLAVDPDTLYFTAIQGEAVPDPDTFSVSETGGGNISYSVNESSAWFDLDKSNGTTPDDVEVTVINTTLSVGLHIDSVEVSSGEADNSPIYEYVVITINEPAPTFNLAVTPDTLEFTAVEGGSSPPSQNFGVTEVSAGNIAFTVSESTDWFALDKAGGVTPDIVTVMVTIGALTPGTYYGDVTVASAEADNSPLTVTIKFTVTAIPKLIMASPNSLGPSMTQGGPPFSPITIHVTDSFNVGLAYTVSENVDWLYVSPASGTTEDSFLVIADTAFANGLGAGIYEDTITITSGEADNSPVYVFATLEVLEEPNNPPVIDTIADQTMNEGDHLEVSFLASDPDGDTLFYFAGGLPSFGVFVIDPDSDGFNNPAFIFDPGFTDAGVYNITANVTDGPDTASEAFTLTVNDQQPGTEGDTVHVGTVPAVPGQQVIVPVDFVNSCDLFAVDVPFSWLGGDFIKLDSIVLDSALLASVPLYFATFDNDAWTGDFGFVIGSNETPIPPGQHAFANLYYSVSPGTPHGAYDVLPEISTTMFGRDCGSGLESVIPVIPGGGGSIVVDTTNVYVCGYVVDEDSLGIWGATVELWPGFPCDGPLMTTTTNGDGAYAFTGFQLGSFDLYAYKSGDDTTTWNDSYYPGLEHVNFGENGIMIVLNWLDPITPSDSWVDYFCDANTLFGCDLPVGSIVEVLDPQDVLCGRQFVRDPGVFRFMPVYRDSAGSVEDEGATTGDNLRFFVNATQALATGDVIYPAEYDTVRVCLSGGERVSKECQLFEGWNLTSWNLNTDVDDIQTVLSSLDGCIDVVLGFEQGGLTYVPGMDIFNTLTAVDHLSGYWIKLKENCNSVLEIEGLPVEPDFPIALNAGWNLVSYLPNEPHLITDALYSIENNFDITYTYDATPLVFVPTMDSVFNTLDFMEPCFGYWIKVNEADYLTYPGPNFPDSVKANLPPPYVAKDATKSVVEPTRNWVNLYSQNLTVDGIAVSAGSEVTAHNLSGGVIGYFDLKEDGPFGFMPVYADFGDENVAGLKKGESFYLSVNGLKTNEMYTWTEQGDLIEVAALTTNGSGNILPESYSLSQNYPNPFNPTTNINFSLPTAGNAKIEIFNLLGQLVATPFDGLAQAGEHKVVWDGKNQSGETAASGIYLYRLVIDDKEIVETRKMTLVK